MMQILKMAFRNLGRNRRRSFFSALALGIGVALLLMIAAFIQGEMQAALESALKLESGHLQLRAKSYDETKSSLKYADLIENPDLLVGQITAQLPLVKVVTPRLVASGIVSSGNETMGVRVLGIDPASEANAPFREGMVSGQFLTADDREGVLVGKTLATKLKLNSGDQVSLSINTSSGDVSEQIFTVRGIYNTKVPGYDEITVFLPMVKAQAITGTENHASLIFILLKDQNQASAVVAALQGSAYQVLSWEKMNETLVQTELYANSMMSLMYLIVLGITATVIVNAFIMAVFERTREIGILSAIGMRGGRILALFFTEAGILVVGGIIIGVILGVAICTYLGKVGFYLGDFGLTGILLGERIYTILTFQDTVRLTIMAFVVSMLAALYPALMAARMEPVEALHGGK
jgi:ABC-type lipoprotein release transport system permease subunit